MSQSKMLTGSSVLIGNNNIPGVKIHKEVKEQIPRIFKMCREWGLDFYPTIIEFLRYDELSEIASYGGFPVRYLHWRFGMEYEQLSRGYEYGMHRISELVINSNPCELYCLDSNTLMENVLVIAHALGHNDFFKNNVFFKDTNTGMVTKFANHASRINKYMNRWGKEVVTEFIDTVLKIETLIDPMDAGRQKTIKKQIIQDERHHYEPTRIKMDHNYMDSWINTDERLEAERKRIEAEESAEYLELFNKPTKNIFAYLKDNGRYKPWQEDILSMLYEESMYFAPQRQTKMLNEGWASYVDFNLMVREGLVSAGQDRHDQGIVEYARHKMMVLGGKWSENPYNLGFNLLMDIEDRWNKGKFGQEWEDCTDMHEREHWDKKLGLGKEKVFEVRAHYNDALAIAEFFTPELCSKLEYYEKKRFSNGEEKVVGHDFRNIKQQLMRKYFNGGLPDIRLTDPNHLGKGWFFMQHYSDGRPLYEKYVIETLPAIWKLWKNTVVLATEYEGKEYLYICDGSEPENVTKMGRKQYEEKHWD